MASFIRRTSNVFKVATSNNLQPGASYYVNVLEPGGIVSGIATTSGGLGTPIITTIPLEAGHGFAAGDRYIIGTDITTYAPVTTASATQITSQAATTIPAIGDVLINLGPDTGSTEPNWDGTAVTIYSDSDGGTAIDNSQVQTNSEGDYDYWHTNIVNLWEVVRTTEGTPVDYVIDAFRMGGLVGLPTTSTDNAIVRWDGTDGGAIQNYTSGAPTISDTGAVTIPLTLAVTGASTLTGLVTASGGITSAGGSNFSGGVSFGTFPGVMVLHTFNVIEQSLEVTSVSANSTSEQTFTVTGLTTSDVVFVNKPTHTSGLIIGNARVSATNTLAITFANITGSPIDPAAETYKIVQFTVAAN